jgi:hypothetical protein
MRIPIGQDDRPAVGSLDRSPECSLAVRRILTLEERPPRRRRPAKPDRPSEVARFELLKLPAAVMLQTVIMAAGLAEIVLDGGPAAGVVCGVVSVSAAGRAPAADHDTAPVPDLEMAE